MTLSDRLFLSAWFCLITANFYAVQPEEKYTWATVIFMLLGGICFACHGYLSPPSDPKEEWRKWEHE